LEDLHKIYIGGVNNSQETPLKQKKHLSLMRKDAFHALQLKEE